MNLVPKWVADADWQGYMVRLDTEEQPVCNCGRAPRRLVAFSAPHTGRRFLGCNHDDPRCTFCVWFDPPYPEHMQRALREVWREISAEITGLSERERKHEEEDAKAVAKAEFVDSVGAIKSLIETVAFDPRLIRDSLCYLSVDRHAQ